MASDTQNRQRRQAKRRRDAHQQESEGQRQQRQSPHGRIRKPNLLKQYEAPAEHVYHLRMQDFRIQVIRPDYYGRPLRIGGITETLNWREEPGNPSLTGDVTIRKPDLGGDVNIHDGHQIKLSMRWGGKWRELWRMRLYDGEESVQGTLTFQLADDIRLLQESRDDWEFMKSKKKGKSKGWLCHEILIEVAKRYRIPLGKVAKGTHYITDLSMKDASPLQVLQRAYAIERRHTTRRFVMRWKNGKLNVLPLRRNPLMYVLSRTIEDAVITKAERSKKFATAGTMRATVKRPNSDKKEKIEVKYVEEKAVAREGYIHKQIKGEDVKDRADAKKQIRKYIKEHSIRALRVEGITHRGIPFLRRGDTMRVRIPGFDFRDHLGQRTQGICFISSGAWSLSGGDFTMQLDVTITDPMRLKKEERERRDRLIRSRKRDGKYTPAGMRLEDFND